MPPPRRRGSEQMMWFRVPPAEERGRGQTPSPREECSGLVSGSSGHAPHCVRCSAGGVASGMPRRSNPMLEEIASQLMLAMTCGAKLPYRQWIIWKLSF